MNKRQMKKAVKKLILAYVKGKIKHSDFFGHGFGQVIARNKMGETALLNYYKNGDSYQQIGKNLKTIGMLVPGRK
jgi:hypothetical protein